MFVPSSLPLDKEKKKNKGRRGSVSVRVGLEEGEFQTFVVPISDLTHPLYKDLLEKAKEVYGCQITGLLRLPCSVEEFQELRSRVERESTIPQQVHQTQLRYLA